MAPRKYGKKGKGRSKRPSLRKAARKAVKAVKQQDIARVCKRVISNMSEVKNIQTINTIRPRNYLAPVSDLAQYNVFMVSPNIDYSNITQGVTSQNRVGNEIRTKYCKAKIVLYPSPYSATTNPILKPQIVTFWCVTPKDGYLSASEMATGFSTSFFQKGNTTQGYNSSLLDIIAPINRDQWVIHWKRQYKLGHATAYGAPNVGTDANYINNAQYSTNDYKMNQIISFDFTKHVIKQVKYNDVTATPECKSTFLICGIANADGTAFTSASYAPVDMYFELDYGFTDM